jgi:hypothetical protein
MARPARPRYEHRQGGGFTRFTFILAVALMPALYLLDPKAGPALLIATPLLLLAFAAFDGLTVRIDGQALSWRFGHLGFPRGHVALTDIASAAVTRTTFWEGWGIRRTRRGWLYNVSGYDAVLVTRRDGKTFLLGSDEARKLKSALDSSLAGLEALPPTAPARR